MVITNVDLAADRCSFNWAVRKLYNRLVQLGAESICSRGESDEQHPEGYVSTLRGYFLTGTE
jgi:hypothetical protein